MVGGWWLVLSFWLPGDFFFMKFRWSFEVGVVIPTPCRHRKFDPGGVLFTITQLNGSGISISMGYITLEIVSMFFGDSKNLEPFYWIRRFFPAILAHGQARKLDLAMLSSWGGWERNGKTKQEENGFCSVDGG